jgi:APA family basic amino acid/polyamine antiporter
MVHDNSVNLTAPAPGSGESAPRLVAKLGLFGTTMIVMGGIIGAGIFINPYVVAENVHSQGLILGAWAAGGIIAMAGAFIYAELAARLPAVGGQYAYLRQAGYPALAFLYGWVLLFVIQTGGMAAVAIIFAHYLRVLGLAQGSDALIAALALGALTLVNCLGVRPGSAVQNFFMVLNIAALAAFIVGGAWFVFHIPVSSAVPSFPAPSPVKDSVFSFGAAMVPVLFAYAGWQTTNFIAEEVREPRKNLPRGLLLGVCGVVVLYVSVNWVCVRALAPASLSATNTPASTIMQLAFGRAGAALMASAIVISALGFLSQSILTAPRVYFAMAEDGLFFRSVAWVHPRSHVPVVAIILQGVWAIVITFSGRYDQILSYVVSMDFLFFGLTAACIFVFRCRDSLASDSREAGWRVPGHPVTTVFFIAASWLVVLDSMYKFTRNTAIGFAILAAGIPAYWLWNKHNRKEGQLPS